MTRVFVDTNIYVSALIFGGKPRVVLQSIDARGIELIATEELRNELYETLTGKFSWTADRAESALAFVFEKAIWVTPDSIPKICRDPCDDYILAAAAHAEADAIVTGDQDLLALRNHGKIEIVTAAEFISRL